jgi:hypothetical protein
MAVRRWYLAGAVAWLLTGVAHLYGEFGGGGGGDPNYQAVTKMMRGYLMDPGTGFNLYEVLECWGLYFGLLCLFIGAMNVAVLRVVQSDRRLLRFMAAVNAGGAIMMLIATAYYRFLPPIVCFGLVLVCFAVAWRLEWVSEDK